MASTVIDEVVSRNGRILKPFSGEWIALGQQQLIYLCRVGIYWMGSCNFW